MENCIFCKIIAGEIPAEKVFENDDFIIIRDVNPKCKNHYLAIPKTHYAHIADADVDEIKILSEILQTLPTLSDKLDLAGGYRLVINQGENAGQEVQHLHIHILSGQKMDWNPA